MRRGVLAAQSWRNADLEKNVDEVKGVAVEGEMQLPVEVADYVCEHLQWVGKCAGAASTWPRACAEGIHDALAVLQGSDQRGVVSSTFKSAGQHVQPVLRGYRAHLVLVLHGGPTNALDRHCQVVEQPTNRFHATACV